MAEDGSHFLIHSESGGAKDQQLEINWQLTGMHNIENALAAIAAAEHVGVKSETAVAALNRFAGVKRRMELIATVGGVEVYDDFAHHPTAIKTSLSAMAKKTQAGKLIAVIEPRSNTMKMGTSRQTIEVIPATNGPRPAPSTRTVTSPKWAK